MNTKPKSKTYVYILKNENDGTYWDGSHHYEMSQGGWGNEPTSNGLPKGWRDRPRYFKTPAALCISLSKMPQTFIDEFIKQNGQPKSNDDYAWRCLKWDSWRDYKKERQLSTIDILKMFAPQNWILYVLEEGKTMRAAKKV